MHSALCGFQSHDHGAHSDFVAKLDLDFFDTASMDGGDFHGSLVRLHGDERLVHGDGVTGLHQQFDHADFGEVANVGHFDIDDCHVCQPFGYSRMRR